MKICQSPIWNLNSEYERGEAKETSPCGKPAIANCTACNYPVCSEHKVKHKEYHSKRLKEIINKK